MNFKRHSNGGFTLVELLVVVAIMGLLGTVSVAGYRQAQQGMEERGTIQNVEQFVRSAYQRSLIDRRPTAVHFWNELIREESDDGSESMVVVGKAVAIRTCGRISGVNNGVLIDEFGDLEQFDEDGDYAKAPEKDSTMRLWQISGTTLRYSTVNTVPITPNKTDHGGIQEDFITHSPIVDTLDKTENKGTIIQNGYKMNGSGSASWSIGVPYCMEFQSIVLPHNYIFGSSFPTSISDPVADVTDMVFSQNDAGSGTIQIFALRPGANGALEAKSIGSTRSPTQEEGGN